MSYLTNPYRYAVADVTKWITSSPTTGMTFSETAIPDDTLTLTTAGETHFASSTITGNPTTDTITMSWKFGADDAPDWYPAALFSTSNTPVSWFPASNSYGVLAGAENVYIGYGSTIGTVISPVVVGDICKFVAESNVVKFYVDSGSGFVEKHEFVTAPESHTYYFNAISSNASGGVTQTIQLLQD